MMLMRESKDKDKLKERVDLLEKQIAELRIQMSNGGSGNQIGMNYVKANINEVNGSNMDEDGSINLGPYEVKEVLNHNHSLR